MTKPSMIPEEWAELVEQLREQRDAAVQERAEVYALLADVVCQRDRLLRENELMEKALRDAVVLAMSRKRVPGGP